MNLAWLKPPRTGIVDDVSWFLTLLGGAGLVLTVFQTLFLMTSDAFADIERPGLRAAIGGSLMLVVGVGLSRRKRWSRFAFVALVGAGALLYSYIALALIAGWPISFLPPALQAAPIRWISLAVVAFWLIVFVFLGARFCRPDITDQFQRKGA